MLVRTFLLCSLLPSPVALGQEGKRPDYWAIESAEERAALPDFKSVPAVPAEELTAAEGKGDFRNWVRSGGDDAATKYSELDQIDRRNVAQLEVAWSYRSGDGKGNIQANPVLADGMLVMPTVGNAVVGVDPATGEEQWRRPFEARPAYRGLVYWPGDGEHGGRVLFTEGARLQALDPKTGEVIFTKPCAESRVAGAVFEHTYVTAGIDKDVFGFDVRTGEKIWTFHTRPHEGEFGHDTWDEVELGANAWGGMALDPVRGLAFVSTGSCKPNFVGVGHRGRNLFSDCVIAIDVRTGKRVWHFQELRHDIWDLDLPCGPVLVTVEREGRRVDAVVQVSKLGHTFLLDRTTGVSLFPLRFRRAPTSLVRGEKTWPYQLAQEIPKPFVRQAFTAEEITDRSPEAQADVLKKLEGMGFGWMVPPAEGKGIAMLPGTHGGAEWPGPAFDPETATLYVAANELPSIVKVTRDNKVLLDETKLEPTAGRKVYEKHCLVCHGPSREGVGTAAPLHGLGERSNNAEVLELLKKGRNPMPPFPHLKEQELSDLLDYLFDRDREYEKPLRRSERPSYRHGGYPKLLDHEGYPGIKPPWGTLTAIDLNTGETRWKIPLGEFEELTKAGLPPTGCHNFGAPIVTAGGLVFVSATKDGKIRAFDKDNGKELWQHRLQFGGSGPPLTYEVDGRQLVVLPATGGNRTGLPTGDEVVAFALPVE